MVKDTTKDVLTKVVHSAEVFRELGLSLELLRDYAIGKGVSAAHFDRLTDPKGCAPCAVNRIAREMGAVDTPPTEPTPAGRAISPLQSALVKLSVRGDKRADVIKGYRAKAEKPSDMILVVGRDLEGAAGASTRFLASLDNPADIEGFVQSHREWTVLHYSADPGAELVILSRDQQDKTQPPDLAMQAFSYARAKAKAWLAGSPKIPLALYEARQITCAMCPARNGERCGACGCPVDDKAEMPTEVCPLSRWPEIKTG